jgi:virulence-associated protein VagC
LRLPKCADGCSQAIRLPKELRVDTDTVRLKCTGEGFLVITWDPWEIFFEGVEQLFTSSWTVNGCNRSSDHGVSDRAHIGSFVTRVEYIQSSRQSGICPVSHFG